MPPGYKVRALSHPRRMAPNLMRSILEVLEESNEPMKEIELVSALGRIYSRIDPDFQRQVRSNLSDGVSYGILNRREDFISIRTRRLGDLMAALAP